MFALVRVSCCCCALADYVKSVIFFSSFFTHLARDNVCDAAENGLRENIRTEQATIKIDGFQYNTHWLNGAKVDCVVVFAVLAVFFLLFLFDFYFYSIDLQPLPLPTFSQFYFFICITPLCGLQVQFSAREKLQIFSNCYN